MSFLMETLACPWQEGNNESMAFACMHSGWGCVINHFFILFLKKKVVCLVLFRRWMQNPRLKFNHFSAADFVILIGVRVKWPKHSFII